MFEENKIIAGIEIGTSKICVVVGELDHEGGLSIIGVGQARSRGVRKGEITNAQQAEEDVRNALYEAEKMADVEIRSVFLGVSGGHLRSFTNRGVHTVVSADREITEDDVQDVIKNAKAINLPADHSLIHAIRQHFYLDGRTGVTNPVGMLGQRLEVEMHVVHGQSTRLQNAIRLVRETQLDVEEIVFNGVASSLAVLNHEQKELGALMVDVGGGTTEYVAYVDGAIRYTGVLAVGGDHVSNDLAYGLKIPLSRAEQLKKSHGFALQNSGNNHEMISLSSEFGLPTKQVSLHNLHSIMSMRLEEIFELVMADLERQGLVRFLRAGVFLCGGTSRVEGILALAENVFQMSASKGETTGISGLTSALEQPEFATAIGLVKYGSLSKRTSKKSSKTGITLVREMFNKVLQRS